MAGIELQSFEMRLGKFEGVQQQHDQRLAEIEHRLGTIEQLMSDSWVEGHRERELLRAEAHQEREAIRTEGRQEREALRLEFLRNL